MSLLEERIGYRFKDRSLLDEALTHKSHAAEHSSAGDNERLEFLGDSVLGLVVSAYLYRKYPGNDEGFLSKARAAYVSRENLARWGGALDLGHFLRLGAGENSSGGKFRKNNLSNAVEALIGAIYLDGGLPAAEAVIAPWLEIQPPADAARDFKSELQEQIQKRHKQPPSYEVTEECGPEHDKRFTVRVFLGRKTLGLGSGRNMKEAHQAAARGALEYLRTHNLRSGDI